MLLGLLGLIIPLLIQTWHRQLDEVIDWGAMQFLEWDRPQRRRAWLAEWLVLAARMSLLGLVALALARPYWTRSSLSTTKTITSKGSSLPRAGTSSARSIVLVLDGSSSMEHRRGGTTPRALALRWATRFVEALQPQDAVALVVAGDRVRSVVAPPTTDRPQVAQALSSLTPPPG